MLVQQMPGPLGQMSFVVSNFEAEAKKLKEVFVVNDSENPIPVTGDIESNPVCPAENVQHWETWRFKHSHDLTHTSNPTILTSVEHHIKFKVDPLQPYERRTTIVDTLIQLGYTDSSGTPILDNLSTTIFESSTIICAEN